MAQTPLPTSCFAHAERRSRSRAAHTSLCVSPNALSFDRQHRRKIRAIRQYYRLKNRSNMLSVIHEHARDCRRAHQVPRAVVDICEQAYCAIAINGKRSGDGFVGKGAADASILAPGGIAITVKADHPHSGDGSRAGGQDQGPGGCESESARCGGTAAGGIEAWCGKKENANGGESFCNFHDFLLGEAAELRSPGMISTCCTL